MVRGHFRVTNKVVDGGMSNLQTDGHFYLCPTCGGYGHIFKDGNRVGCEYCKSLGEIPLDDPRVKDD